MLFKNILMFPILCSLFGDALCSDEKGVQHESEGVHEIKHEEHPQHIHTIHHHHIQKYTVIKKIEVPVIKEVKVPYKVYVIEKVPYKYYVKPLIVKVPIDYYHTKEEEHDHQEKHEEQHHEEGHEEIGEHHHEPHHELSRKRSLRAK